jgi:hypothetical protein
VSDVRSRTSSFFDLYSAGQVPEAAINDFVENWHTSGDKEVRPLSDFLGMTDDEYAVWVMDGRTLPLLRDARQAREQPAVAVTRYLDRLRAEADPLDRAAVHALSHWVARRAGETHNAAV